MINSRDSYADFNPNKKLSIEVPYEIGTIIELNEDSNILAKICQYRVIVRDYRQIITVGLSSNIQSQNTAVEYEITSEELEKKWKKTEKIIIGELDSKNFVHFGMLNPAPVFHIPIEEINGPIKTLNNKNIK